MENSQIDLRELSVPSAMDLTLIPLDVALLLRDWGVTQGRGLVIQRQTRWFPLCFQSLAHAKDVLSQRSVHIFIAHWHVDSGHTFDNHVTQFVKYLKSKRMGPGIGSGPLLVGGWLTGGDDDENLVRFLNQTYDCSMEYLETGPERFVPWIAEQLWALLPSKPRHPIWLE